MKLHDETIAHIARIIQMAMITGTDIVDHLRMMELENKEEILVLSKEYQASHDKNLHEMIQNIQDTQEDMEEK